MARAYDDAEPPQDDGLARAALCRRSPPASDIGHHHVLQAPSKLKPRTGPLSGSCGRHQARTCHYQ
jgi:hypothetical protein